jgi:hypothetical protein
VVVCTPPADTWQLLVCFCDIGSHSMIGFAWSHDFITVAKW